MEDDENDIWNYQVKCKRYKKGNRLETEKNAVRRRETGHDDSKSGTESKKNLHLDNLVHVKGSKLETNTKKSRKIRSVSPKPNPANVAAQFCSSEPNSLSQNSYNGFCPLCQVPFSVLVARVETPSWHVTECVERIPSTKECPYGTRCDNTIPQHYQEYNHQRLAQMRSDVSDRAPVIKVEDVDSSHLYPTLSTDTKVIQGTCSTISSVISSDSISKLSPCINQSHGADTLSDNDSEIICSPVDVLKMIDSATNISNDDACSDSNIDDIDSDGDSNEDILASLDCNEPCVAPDLDQVTNTDECICEIQIEDLQQNSTDHKKMDQDEQNDLLPSQALGSDLDNISLNSQETLSQSEKWAAVFTPKKAKLASQSLSSLKPLSSSQTNSSHKRSGSTRKKKTEDKSRSCRQSKSPGSKVIKSQMSLTSFFKVESNKKSEVCQSVDHSNELTDLVDQYDNDVYKCNFKIESATNVDDELLDSIRTDSDAPPSFAGKASDGLKESTSFLTKARFKRSATDILMANRGNITTVVNSQLRKNGTSKFKQTRQNLQDAEKNEGMNPVPNVEIKNMKDANNGTSSSKGWPTEKSTMKKRYCPFYKKIPGTGFTVDAFKFGEISGCTGYFLSHYHYDHYQGLTKKFSGKLFCSQITANLVLSLINLKKEVVHPLPMNSPCVIENVQVTFLEANHCPGAVLILFQLKSGSVYLHTGDFRADPSMETHPALNSLKVQQLYLDTTYCNPTYDFPPQNEVIHFAVNLVLKELQNNSNTVIVCGSYTIGKEKIFIAISEALGCKICVAKDKQRILSCLEDENLKEKLSLDYNESRLHVLPMSKLNIKNLKEHMSSLKTKYSGLIALEPTGWSYSNVKSLEEIKPKTNRNGIKIIGVPYSEHSSFLELKRFVQYLRPEKILPTVNNGNPQSRKQMENIFKSWMEESG